MKNHGGRWFSWLIVLLMLVPLGMTAATQSLGIVNAAGTSGTQYTLQGCRNNQTTPPYKAGTFICNDALYTTGDLGKGWAELDYVPFRLIVQTGKTGGQISRNLDVDYLFKNGVYGYDLLSVPVLNTAADDGTDKPARPVTTSAAACAFTVSPGSGAANQGSSPNGSATNSLYRTLTITNMPANATCVFDFYARVALGAHNVAPGKCDAKLHADLADSSNNIQGSGAKEVPIQICNINGQSVAKSMTVTDTQDYLWDVNATPKFARITFDNTCDATLLASQNPQSNPVTVTWHKVLQSTTLVASTHVSVVNPASRPIGVNLSDQIYDGSTSPATPVGSPLTWSGTVKSNSVPTPIDQQVTLPAGTSSSNLYDVVTATYYDPQDSTPIGGSVTAQANATLQTFTQNGTAVITDVESILGGSSSPFAFSINDFQVYDGNGNAIGSQNSGGSLGSYTLGTQTTGPVTWTSDTESDSGSVVLDKYIYLTGTAPVIANDELTELATVTASSGFVAYSSANGQPVNYDLDANATATLTINKTIPFTLSSTDAAQTFTFHVTDPDGNEVMVSGQSPTITLSPGQNTGSVQIPGLQQGETYTVSEDQAPGWDAPPASQGQTINIQNGNSASCGSYSVTFANTIHANVTVQKITNPAGNEAGWTFNLLDPNGKQISQVTTTDAGAIAFPVNLTQEGQYTVQEVSQPGWLQTNAQNATFTVDFPASGAVMYAAAFTNSRESASATVQKVTYPAGNEAGWSFTLYDPNGTAIGTATTTGTGAINFVDSGGNPVKLTVAGTYTVKETSTKSGWWNTASTGQTFTINWSPGGTTNGQTYAAQFTNTKCVTPAITAGNVNGVATFTITDPNTPSKGTGLIGGSLPALNPLALGTQVSSTGTNGVGIKVVKLTNATMPAASWVDGAGSLVLSASKVNASTGASIGLVATALGGTPATVTVSSTGAVTVTNAGTCSNAFDPLLTSSIRQAGQPQTDIYNGIDQSESRLTVYNGKPGLSNLKIQVNGTTFTANNLQDGQQQVLDISSALTAGGNNTVTVTSIGKPGGSAVLLVAPPGS